MEAKGNLPKLQVCLKYSKHMESEESSNEDHTGQQMRKHEARTISKEKTLTAHKRLESLRHKVALVHEDISQYKPDFLLQLLGDHFKLQEASTQLSKKAKDGNLDVIVQGRIAAMVGLLNIYTDRNLEYSWKGASEIVSKMQGHGTNHARCIRKWVLDFLKWGNLPLH